VHHQDAPSAPKSVAAATADAKKKAGGKGSAAKSGGDDNSGLVASSAAAVRLFTSSSDVDALIKLAQDTWMVGCNVEHGSFLWCSFIFGQLSRNLLLLRPFFPLFELQ